MEDNGTPEVVFRRQITVARNPNGNAFYRLTIPQELAEYLSLISGGRVEIRAVPGKKEILIKPEA